MEVFPRSDDSGLGVGKGSVEVVVIFDHGSMMPVVLVVHQLGRMTGSSFLGLPKARLDGCKGKLRHL